MMTIEQDEIALLLSAGANPNAKDNLNQTALFYAPLEKTKLLLDAGASADIRNTKRQPAFSVTQGEEILILLANHMNINYMNGLGETVLFRDNNLKRIQIALGAGADPFLKNAQGKTALEVAREESTKYKNVIPILEKAMQDAKTKSE